ncbi:hypothetical protein C8Q73DRAFT_836153 [Cubamyces lactineus]|nr:hypothetical protein C8Q73DRAFT_836153 [Cubamyces lactineus]
MSRSYSIIHHRHLSYPLVLRRQKFQRTATHLSYTGVQCVKDASNVFTVQIFAGGSTKATYLSQSLSTPSSFTISYPLSLVPPQCTEPDYSWLSNSKGQSACSVAKAVADSCVESVQDSTEPLPDSSCPCNTVLYSLINACALCADVKALQSTFDAWSNFMDCEGTLLKEYPTSLIPSGVIIPLWAFLDLTSNDDFDVAGAKDVAAQATSTGLAEPPAAISNSASGTTPSRTTSARITTNSQFLVTASSTTESSKALASGLPSFPQAIDSSGTAASATISLNATAQGHLQTSLATNSGTEAPTQMSSPTMTSSIETTSSRTTDAHAQEPQVAAPGKPATTSIAVIVGPTVGGASALVLIVCGVATVVVRTRRRRRRQVRKASVDPSAAFQQLWEGVGVQVPTLDPAPEHAPQLLPEPPASQPPRALSPQKLAAAESEHPAAPSPHPCERPLTPPVPEIMMNLYDPDDPATYPPPLSVILGRHVVPASEWDDLPDYSP